MQNPTFLAKLEEFYPETHERVMKKEMELRPELMKTIFFSNRERIMIGDDHMQYLDYLKKKLPGPDYQTYFESSVGRLSHGRINQNNAI